MVKDQVFYLCSYPDVTLSYRMQLADILHRLISAAHKDASSRSMRGTKTLRDFEIPAAVILDADSWTQRNGMLTVTGKPRRDRVRSKFLKEMQNIYSALSMAHTGAGDGEPQCIPTATVTVVLQSPYPEIDPAPTPLSSMPVKDLDLIVPDTADAVLQSPPQSSMLVADRAVLVASLSAYWGSRTHARQAVTVRFPAVLDLSCSLQAPFAALVMSLSRTVGPLSVAQVKNCDLPFLAILPPSAPPCV